MERYIGGPFIYTSKERGFLAPSEIEQQSLVGFPQYVQAGPDWEIPGMPILLAMRIQSKDTDEPEALEALWVEFTDYIAGSDSDPVTGLTWKSRATLTCDDQGKKELVIECVTENGFNVPIGFDDPTSDWITDLGLWPILWVSGEPVREYQLRPLFAALYGDYSLDHTSN